MDYREAKGGEIKMEESFAQIPYYCQQRLRSMFHFLVTYDDNLQLVSKVTMIIVL